jgi:hypothetical protein
MTSLASDSRLRTPSLRSLNCLPQFRHRNGDSPVPLGLAAHSPPLRYSLRNPSQSAPSSRPAAILGNLISRCQLRRSPPRVSFCTCRRSAGSHLSRLVRLRPFLAPPWSSGLAGQIAYFRIYGRQSGARAEQCVTNDYEDRPAKERRQPPPILSRSSSVAYHWICEPTPNSCDCT